MTMPETDSASACSIETDENKNCALRNLSFDSIDGLSYHQKYYYPKLVWNKKMEDEKLPSDAALQRFVGSGERGRK